MAIAFLASWLVILGLIGYLLEQKYGYNVMLTVVVILGILTYLFCVLTGVLPSP